MNLNISIDLIYLSIIKTIKINNMMRIQNQESQFVVGKQKFKRAQSTESISTVQDTSKGNVSRLICSQIKSKFIELITKRNYSMKEAAKKVNMSYSTAKKIYRKFRINNISKNTKPVVSSNVEASYVELVQNIGRPIKIICLIAGNTQGEPSLDSQ